MSHSAAMPDLATSTFAFCVLSVAEQAVIAPPTQSVFAGTSISLQCLTEVPGTHATWQDTEDNPFSGLVLNASSADSGDYTCTIVDFSTGGAPIYSTMVQLQVIGMIISYSAIYSCHTNNDTIHDLKLLN